MATHIECANLHTIDSLATLETFEVPASNFYVIGEGSNTLFVDEQSPELIKVDIKGIGIVEAQDSFILTIGAGENWHDLVKFTVENGMPGLENLALIPGSVGAAPIQNIGAYGSEFSMFCHSVSWFSFDKKQIITMTGEDCQFGYRDSIFKGELKGQGLITQVTLCLPKVWQPKLNYSGLDTLPKDCDASQVMEKVIAIRESKLPNPAKLANCGSFFKNPVVDIKTFEKLISEYPTMPNYVVSDKAMKLAAGWLIEQAGLKGYRCGDAGVHEKQALVLVNYGQAKGKEMIALAQMIITNVKKKFGIELSTEVRLVSALGEVDMSSLDTYV
ncbi:MAG: UDP-N-acetylenolpyruvoylglucosamine reductase [Colwelliaceae bacterium]|nr:UDP-N-acetylenolpyruvoylglucosamine reductase [Colwelliaceae bacterium]